MAIDPVTGVETDTALKDTGNDTSKDFDINRFEQLPGIASSVSNSVRDKKM